MAEAMGSPEGLRVDRSPQDPLRVVSVLAFSPDEECMLLGVRSKTPNEQRHEDMASTFTKEVPPSYYRSLSGCHLDMGPGDEAERLLLPPPAFRPFEIGRGKHGQEDVFVIEAVLGKAGLGPLISAGLITGLAVPAYRARRLVPDQNTRIAQWTDMLTYKLRLDSLQGLPGNSWSSACYDPIVWVPAKNIPRAYAENNAALLDNPLLTEGFVCTGGLCVLGAARVIQHARGGAAAHHLGPQTQPPAI